MFSLERVLAGSLPTEPATPQTLRLAFSQALGDCQGWQSVGWHRTRVDFSDLKVSATVPLQVPSPLPSEDTGVRSLGTCLGFGVWLHIVRKEPTLIYI